MQWLKKILCLLQVPGPDPLGMQPYEVRALKCRVGLRIAKKENCGHLSRNKNMPGPSPHQSQDITYHAYCCFPRPFSGPALQTQINNRNFVIIECAKQSRVLPRQDNSTALLPSMAAKGPEPQSLGPRPGRS